jgi:hypothetical protein
MGKGSFPGVNRPGRGVDHPPPSSTVVKERVGLCLYSPSGPSWPVLGCNLPLSLLYFTCSKFGGGEPVSRHTVGWELTYEVSYRTGKCMHVASIFLSPNFRNTEVHVTGLRLLNCANDALLTVLIALLIHLAGIRAVLVGFQAFLKPSGANSVICYSRALNKSLPTYTSTVICNGRKIISTFERVS